jgi:hypothetical protein
MMDTPHDPQYDFHAIPPVSQAIDDEEFWLEPPTEPLTPEEEFDLLFEGYRDAQEDVNMRTVLASLAGKVQACPQCRCTNLLVLGEYRKCPLCNWKGKINQPSQGEVQA